MLRRIDPLALIVDASEGAHGANDGVGGGHDARRFLDDVAEREADVAAAAIEKLEGAGVAIHGAAADFVFLGDFGGAVPAEETLLDGLAIGMRANSAVALVVFEQAGAGWERWRLKSEFAAATIGGTSDAEMAGMAAVFGLLLGGLFGSADSFGIGLLSSDPRRFGGFRFGSLCLGDGLGPSAFGRGTPGRGELGGSLLVGDALFFLSLSGGSFRSGAFGVELSLGGFVGGLIADGVPAKGSWVGEGEEVWFVEFDHVHAPCIDARTKRGKMEDQRPVDMVAARADQDLVWLSWSTRLGSRWLYSRHIVGHAEGSHRFNTGDREYQNTTCPVGALHRI